MPLKEVQKRQSSSVSSSLAFHYCVTAQAMLLTLQVRSLGETVRLDARTKLLNPKWYEGMLNSGYEGVREIQKRLTNTVGWSATSGQVRLIVCLCICPSMPCVTVTCPVTIHLQ